VCKNQKQNYISYDAHDESLNSAALQLANQNTRQECHEGLDERNEEAGGDSDGAGFKISK